MIPLLQQKNVLGENKQRWKEAMGSSKPPDTSLSIHACKPALVSQKDGLWTIMIPPGAVLSEPIVISTVLSSFLQRSKIVIVVEEGASAVVVETQKSCDPNNSEEQFQRQEVEVHTQRSARLSYCTLHNTNLTTSSTITKRGLVDENAVLTWIDVLCGGKWTEFDLKTIHQGRSAQSKAYTLYSGGEGQIFEINTETDHCDQQTSGLMKARGILTDNARVSYRGAVHISPFGGGAIAHQKSETLLLGDQAHCDALPVLDVHHDDVVCSHGAAMGRIEEETLFYLVSRGLNKEMAMHLFMESFFHDYLREVSVQSFICEIQQTLGEKIKKSELK